jgi:hypothetical protein
MVTGGMGESVVESGVFGRNYWNSVGIAVEGGGVEIDPGLKEDTTKIG